MANLSKEDSAKIDSAKKKYADAQAKGDKAGMESAHKEAESIRANYGYSGGADGSQNIALNSNNDGSWIGTGTSKANRNSGTSSSMGTSTDYGSYQDDLERLSKAQQKTQIAQLKQARDKALANLDVQEQEIKPTYQTARNQASATSQSGARSFAEYLANRGLTNSGASAQGEINRLSALQNSLGNIDTAEANAYRDIANQRTAVENDYVAGVANANNAIAQEYYNNLLNYNQQQREYIQNLEEQALGRYANDYYQAYLNYINQGGNPNDLYAKQLLARSGNKQQTLTNNSITNGNDLVSHGIINYNTAGGAGMTIAEAQQYYNNLLAQQQAQAQAEADQQAFENYIKRQQLANDTAQTNYNINKPYSSSSSNKDSNKEYSLTLSQVDEQLTPYFGNNEAIKNKIFELETSGLINEKQAQQLFAYYGVS